MKKKIVLIGAGLTGPLLAYYLSERGFKVEIYERRSDLRCNNISAGRSINLALSARGINALMEVGIYDRIAPFAIPMGGRNIHDIDSSEHLQSYGQSEKEVIYSISRSKLNMEIMTLAESTGKIKINFNHSCTNVNLKKNLVYVTDEDNCKEKIINFDIILGVDGSGSAVRDAMVREAGVSYNYKPLDHSYKELTIPPDANGYYQMNPNALHIWPRGKFMLIALPNIDKSFTCTLFMPEKGEISFNTVSTDNDIIGLFSKYFPDTIPLIPKLISEFKNNPTGKLGSVYCDPWHFEDKAAILGDAAHALVPFFGQGMNASFQDCSVLNNLIKRYENNWGLIFSEFSRIHVKNGHAIVKMALENYIEMRDHVNDPDYKNRRKLELKLERMFPEEFIPRYSMVSFHQIEYSEVYAKGEKQFNILEKILNNYDIAEVDRKTAKKFMFQQDL